MTEKIVITVLADDQVHSHGLLAEHGLSFWIEFGDKHILFDTGQGIVLSHNADKLDIALENTDAIVISHGHYDHIGGLNTVLDLVSCPNVYMHPKALQRKYARTRKSSSRYIGTPLLTEDHLSAKTCNVIWTSSPTEILEQIYVTGEIPRQSTFEDTGGDFYLDERCTHPDPILDDQALYLECDQGLVVILGCGHAGIINTLNYIAEISGRCDILAVLGGMHLLQADQHHFDLIGDALLQYNVQVIAPAHCTGQNGMTYLLNRFPGQYMDCAVGSHFTFSCK